MPLSMNEWTLLDNEGLFIESWSSSTEYSAEILTMGAQSWQVEDWSN